MHIVKDTSDRINELERTRKRMCILEALEKAWWCQKQGDPGEIIKQIGRVEKSENI
jgi:hypothetical protein